MMSMHDTAGKTGTVLEIQRMSTEDGPGIRTTAFLKGCTLKCRWCHNPESINSKPQVHWIKSRCIGCGLCVKVCPFGVLKQNDSEIEIERDLCTGCGNCTDECPTTAIELLGKQWTAEALADELGKDKSFFEQSGGGVTISGGEPLMQNDFTLAVLKLLKHRGISTAIDTCGMVKQEALEKVLPFTDIILYDIKEIDPALHKKFTGCDNELILSNFLYALSMKGKPGGPEQIWVRTPVIPGMTATEKNISGIGKFIAGSAAGNLDRWELCAFNNLCRDKYLRLGLDWCLKNEPPVTDEKMEELYSKAIMSGVSSDIVTWSGPTRFDESSSVKN